MSASELKHKIVKQINELDKKDLQEAYGVLLNFFSSKDDSTEWKRLSKKQQDGIKAGLKELDAKKGIAHKDVIRAFRKKYHA